MSVLKETEKTIIGEISKEIAIKMIKAANDTVMNQRAASNDKTPITHCVWFGLDQINDMVTELNAEQLAGCGTDGLRVYFGKYSNETIGKDDKNYNEYLGRDTVLFVSTKKHSDGKSHLDYFERILPKPVHMLPENRGELCEPKSTCIGSQFE